MDRKTGRALQARLETATDYDILDVNIFLAREPAAAEELADEVDDPSARDPQAVVGAIRARAEESQQGIISYLSEVGASAGFVDDETGVSVPPVGPAKSFWINNAVGVEVTREVLQGILDRPDVLHVELTGYAEIEELVDATKGGAGRGAKGGKGKRKSLFVEKIVRHVEILHAREVDDVSTAAGAIVATDTEAEPTWSVKFVNAPMLWGMGLTGEGVLVAVLDTGVNYNHPDLRNNMWDGGEEFPNHGFDFMTEDKDPMDDGPPLVVGHGTACAGIVAGDGTSGTKTGVAPKAKILAVRVGGSERSFWRGLEFALERGAQVISMSMTWKHPSSPDYPGWRRNCESVLAASVLHANSTGNQGNDLTRFPLPFNIGAPGNCPPPRTHPSQTTAGGLSSAISCGAVDNSGKLAASSGRGPCAWEDDPYSDYAYQDGAAAGLIKPDICAPGQGSTSCNWRFPNNSTNPYRSFGGTSAATPHVAGCLALLAHACLRSQKPIIPARVQEAIESTAVRIPGQNGDKEINFGAGRIDVYAAYKYGAQKGWWE